MDNKKIWVLVAVLLIAGVVITVLALKASKTNPATSTTTSTSTNGILDSISKGLVGFFSFLSSKKDSTK